MARLNLTEHQAIGMGLPELDITRPEELSAALKSCSPDLVINCAAYTEVDKAETEAALAFLVNRDGAANLADACKERDIPLIHISTDYVFDGQSRLPYKEADPVNPLGVYGRSKWAGEEAVRSSLPEHLIIRTAWLFGVHGHSFVGTILRLAREKEEIKVVADQFGCPTWTGDLADGLVKIAETVASGKNRVEWGTYHFCGKGKVSWHGFARAVIDEGRRREALKVREILPIDTAEYPAAAARPAWSVLDCSKVETNFNLLCRDWRQGLKEMMLELYGMQT